MPTLVKTIEGLLEKGNLKLALEKLRTVPRKTTSRLQRRQFAELARQAGIPELGLQMLAPIVRSRNAAQAKPTGEEKVIYAACLIRLGILEEAKTILNEVKPEEEPNVFLFQAHALMGEWNYSAAIPFLLQYEKLTRSHATESLMARLNLAAAYVGARDFDNALPLLIALEEVALESPWIGSILELRSQVEIAKKNWDVAETLLKRASEKLSEGVFGLLIRKWSALLQLTRRGNTKPNLDALEKVREEALALRHWETVRDCDFKLALARDDRALLFHVYFGTSFPEFRKRVLQQYAGVLLIPDQFDWKIGKEDGPLINLSELIKNFESETEGRLAQALASDFYRPFSVGSLHNVLFTGEYFNPDSSPDRIYTLVHQLKKKLPPTLVIKKGTSGYRLDSKGCTLRLPLKPVRIEKSDDMDRLRQFFPDFFSAAEAIEKLGLPERTVQRYLTDGIAQGILLREGAGKATLYRFRKRNAVA